MSRIASINELAVLSNLESLNAELIKSSFDKYQRLQKLKEIGSYQLNILNDVDYMKTIKKLNEQIYIDRKNQIKE